MTSAAWSFNPQSVPTAQAGREPRGRSGTSKVPEVVFGFWIVKILATTLGETAGDALSMSLELGYLVSTGIFAVVFAALAIVQIRAARFHPFLYWAVVVASTTVGTTLADFATRSIGIGYVGGSLLLAALVCASLAVWYLTLGSVSVRTIRSPKVEAFYWITILFSQTLGTALGDFAADDGGLGYGGGALVFGAAIAVTAVLYYATDLSRVVLFWAAFILTRPLGATVGDFLDKPIAKGGLNLDRFAASGVLVAAIVLCILVLPQRSADHPAAGK